MGKKLDALFGRSFKTSKFKAIANLAVSRLAVLKKQRRARCSVARSDVVQFLNLGHHERALLRVEQVIKEQNMLDVLLIIESYCLLLIERIKLVENEKGCPDELKAAIASLIYATTRCGDFPELQEIRLLFTSRFGKEFGARAVELRNNCGVNPKMIQKLSTRQPDLEDRIHVLKEIASENSIALQIEGISDGTKEEELVTDHNKNQSKPDPWTSSDATDVENNLQSSCKEMVKVDNSQISCDEIATADDFPDSTVAKPTYKDVAHAAQAAFESAAYAAAAARAAVVLSKFEPQDPDDHNSPSPSKNVLSVENRMKSKYQAREVIESFGIKHPSFGLGFEKIPSSDNNVSDIEDEKIRNDNILNGIGTSSHAVVMTKPLRTEMVSDKSEDDKIRNDYVLNGIGMSSHTVVMTEPVRTEMVFDKSDDGSGKLRIHDLVFNTKASLSRDEVSSSEKFSDVTDEEFSQSEKQFPLRSQGGSEELRHSKAENRPVSIRTRQGYLNKLFVQPKRLS